MYIPFNYKKHPTITKWDGPQTHDSGEELPWPREAPFRIHCHYHYHHHPAVYIPFNYKPNPTSWLIIRTSSYRGGAVSYITLLDK